MIAVRYQTTALLMIVPCSVAACRWCEWTLPPAQRPLQHALLERGGELLWSGAAVVPRAQTVDSVSAATLSSDHTPECSRIYRTVSSTFTGKSSYTPQYLTSSNCLKTRTECHRWTVGPSTTPLHPPSCVNVNKHLVSHGSPRWAVGPLNVLLGFLFSDFFG